MTQPTLPAGLIAIHNPKKPGDYLVIGVSDFNPRTHTRFTDPPPAVRETRRPDVAPLGTSTAPVDEGSAGTESSSKAGSTTPAEPSRRRPRTPRAAKK